MKRFLSVLLVLILSVGIAYADSPEKFIDRWNNAANVYGAPELGDYTQGFTSYSFTGEGWKLTVEFLNKRLITKAEATADDSDVFLAICATLGAAILTSKTADTLMQYDGIILNNYLRIVSDRESRTATLAAEYNYHLEKTESGYLIIMERVD